MALARLTAAPTPLSDRAAAVLLAACTVLLGCGADTPAAPTPTRPATLTTAASPTARPDASSLATAVASAAATASPSASAPLTSAALRDGITVDAIRRHLEQLQGIADAHGGDRAAGTAGFDASVAYVAERLTAAGYTVASQPFTYPAGAGVNLIAERSGPEDAEVVVLGAHLDSSPGSPGINDNGSGSTTLLALAEALTALDPARRTIRFAFWGAEEPGRFGSTAYVAALSEDERSRITAYLNLDLIGSTNFIRFAYDEPTAPPGSAALTSLFDAYFDELGLPWEPIDLAGKSDHAAFAAAGIPTGGLFSGGREPKTDSQAAAFGGTVGLPADGCADHACDTIANVSDVILDQMADAAAHALATLATR